MESLNRQKLIRLSKSCIGDAEKLAVMGVLDREYLGMGAEVQEFEQALSEFFGRPAVCVVNGTAALHLSLEACGIGMGDEVLVQSTTYIASFQAISATGAKPVACDVNPSTLTIDLLDAEKRLTSRTKAIMPVHYSGGVGDLDEIYRFTKKHKLRVIEDAAHAFGTVYRGKRVGGFGDIACFSFDGIKNITAGEGGCIVTNDVDVLRRVKDARLLGVEKDTEMRYMGQRSWEFDVTEQGWRYHMNNIMAGIGIEQLKRFPEFATRRQKLAQLYDTKLAKVNGVRPLAHNYNEVVPHIYVVQLAGDIDRQQLRKNLRKYGVETGVHYQPNHQHSFYRDNTNSVLLPNVERLYPSILSLPLHPGLTEDDVEFVSERLRQSLSEST